MSRYTAAPVVVSVACNTLSYNAAHTQNVVVGLNEEEMEEAEAEAEVEAVDSEVVRAEEEAEAEVEEAEGVAEGVGTEVGAPVRQNSSSLHATPPSSNTHNHTQHHSNTTQ